MSLLRSIRQQLGLMSGGNESQNHFFDGSVANQLTLKRGVPDAPGATVMQVVDGVVSFPQGMSGLRKQSETKNATGTAVNFTVPLWAKKLTLLFNRVSTNGTNNHVIRMGPGAVENSDYTSLSSTISTSGANNAAVTSSGFAIAIANAGNFASGKMELSLANQASDLWVSEGQFSTNGAANVYIWQVGNKAFAAPIDTLQITTVNQVDTFDSGTFTLICEE